MTEDQHTTKFGTTAFALVAIIPSLATILFGGVDTGTWMLIALLTAATVVCWIADSLRTGVFNLSTISLQLPLLVLVVLGLVQLLPIDAIRSLDPYNTRLFLVRLVCYLAFLAAALVVVNSEGRIKIIAFGTVIFGAVMAFLATLQRLASPDAIYGFREPFQAVPFGPFVNQHHFAGFMEMTGSVAMALLLTSVISREKKLLLAIAAVIMALACVLTSSRGGLACFVAGIVFVALTMRFVARSDDKVSAKSMRNLGIAFALFAVIVVALVVFVGGDQSLLRGIGLQTASNDFSSGRLHFWTVALSIFKANPVFGAGLDAFGVAFTQHDTWNGTFRVEQAHNEYLQLLAEGGIVALGCALAFAALLVRVSFRNIRRTSDPLLKAFAVGSLGGCVAIMLHSLVDFPLRTPSNAFFFLLLSVVATTTSLVLRKDA